MSRRLSHEEISYIDREKRTRLPIGIGIILIGLASLPFLIGFCPYNWIVAIIWFAVLLIGVGIIITTPNYAKCNRCHVVYDNLWDHSGSECLSNLKRALEELK